MLRRRGNPAAKEIGVLGRAAADAVAGANGGLLWLGQTKLEHVGLLILAELGTVVGRIERKTHFIERIAFLGLLAVKWRGALNGGQSLLGSHYFSPGFDAYQAAVSRLHCQR